MLWKYYAEIGWVASIGAFYGVTVYLEKKAAMRGSNRAPLSKRADKGLRVFFLGVITAPLCYLFPYYAIPATLLYLPSYIDEGEKTGKRMTSVVKEMRLWKWMAKYFQLEVVAAGGKLDPEHKHGYVVAVHPHGFLPVGTAINLLTNNANIEEKFLNGAEMHWLAASFCFYIPIYRDIILGAGIIDAARYNARAALDRGFSIALVPGGATEALYAHPGVQKLVLKKRLGFVKLAIETGADLVPGYSFGETDCYSQLASKWPWVRKIQTKFQSIFGLSLPLVTNIIPRRSKITTVFGKPILVTRNENPSEEEVRALLDVYIKELTELFYAHCDKYIKNPKHRQLVIVD